MALRIPHGLYTMVQLIESESVKKATEKMNQGIPFDVVFSEIKQSDDWDRFLRSVEGAIRANMKIPENYRP